jgi:hypothetical protein
VILNYVSRFSNYGITVVLNWIKKCNGKLMAFRCSFRGSILVLFLSKACLAFQVSMMVLSESYGPGFVDALKDRMSLYSADLLRSRIFILLVAVVLWLYKNKIAQNTAIILVGLFMVSDLFC